MTLSNIYYAIAIHWSSDLLPQIPISVGSYQLTFRTIDTDGTTPIIVHDPAVTNPIRFDMHVGFPTTPRIQFTMPVVFADFANAPHVMPVRPRSYFATLPITDGFMITPDYFLPVPRNFNKKIFCAPGSSFVSALAHIEAGWELESNTADRIRIDSASSDIVLGNSKQMLFDIFLVLEELGYTYLHDRNTGTSIIRECDISILNEILPAIKFTVTTISGDYTEIIFEPREYMRYGNDGYCHLGLAFSDNSQTRIGSAMFRKYAVSFSNRNKSISFCLGK